MKYLSEKIKNEVINMNSNRFSNTQIAIKLKITPGKVAGIIWRHKNPGIRKIADKYKL